MQSISSLKFTCTSIQQCWVLSENEVQVMLGPLNMEFLMHFNGASHANCWSCKNEFEENCKRFRLRSD